MRNTVISDSGGCWEENSTGRRDQIRSGRRATGDPTAGGRFLGQLAFECRSERRAGPAMGGIGAGRVWGWIPTGAKALRRDLGIQEQREG